jgi:Tol biopolymer transport system component
MSMSRFGQARGDSGYQKATQRIALLATSCLLYSCARPAPLPSEHQLTRIVGKATSPVLSRDCKNLVFAATPDDHSNPQIWTMRLDVAPSTPLQLTTDNAQNYDPALTADGKSVLYTSSRNPPGIYRVSVAGGANELVIENGLAPKISPDGKVLLYGNALALLKRPFDGGPSSPILPAAENSYAPAWSPDGSQIMVTAKDAADHDPQWWIVPVSGGELRKTAIVPELHKQGFTTAFLNAWLPDDWIVFSGIQGETMTLWKVKLDRDASVQGRAQRATQDAEGDYGASYSCGKLVYSRTQVDMNFWALALDETGLHLKGPPRSLTSGPARKGQQSVAGSKLLYSAESSRGFSLVLKDLASGSEKQLKDGFFALLSPNGSHYIYGAGGTYQDLSLLMRSTSWWPFWSSSVCQHCGMPRGLSPDGKRLLVLTDEAQISRLTILDLDNGHSTELVSSPEVLTSPNLSADGNWVTFVARVGEHNWQTFVVPVSAQKMLGSSEWIPVMPVSDSFHFAFWSERGDLIYNLTARGGSGNLKWLEAQPVDEATKHPTGVPTEIYEFSDMLVPGMDPNWNTITAGGGKIVLELGEVSTNIWTKDLK